ncbi:hypothetical protein D3C87_1753640 [compost metagenome]
MAIEPAQFQRPAVQQETFRREERGAEAEALRQHVLAVFGLEFERQSVEHRMVDIPEFDIGEIGEGERHLVAIEFDRGSSNVAAALAADLGGKRA